MSKLLGKILNWFKLCNATLLSVFRIVFLSKSTKPYRHAKAKKDRIVILGNGPSFKKTIDENLEFFKSDKNELVCLNHFAITDYYTELKPKYYFAIAHDLFLDEAAPEYIEASNKLFTAIVEKTTWKLNFFIAYEAKAHKRWQRILRQNDNIEISYLNLTPIEGFDSFVFRNFRKGRGMPRPHNVMIPAIFTAINLNAKEIFLIGADHSWMKELVVNDNNRVMFFDKHFYDAERQLKSFNFEEDSYPKIHQILASLSKAFASYHILNNYAVKRQIEIFNCTPNSYIDAFKRCKIENCELSFVKTKS